MRAAALGFLRFYPDETNLSIYSSFKLIAGENLVGRSPECDVQLCYPDISNLHCKIIIAEDNEYSIEDLVGSNGVFKATGDSARQRLKPGKEYELVSKKPFYLANKYRCVFEANPKVVHLAVDQKPVEIDLEDQATVILQDRLSPPSLSGLDVEIEIKQQNDEEKKIIQQAEDEKEKRKASLENIKQKENSVKPAVAKEQPKPNKSNLSAPEKVEEKRRSTRNTKSVDVVIVEEPKDKSPVKSRSKDYPPEKSEKSLTVAEPSSEKKVQFKPTKSKDKMEEEKVEVAPKKTRSKSQFETPEKEEEKNPPKDVKKKEEKKPKSPSSKADKKAVKKTRGSPEKVIEELDTKNDEKPRKTRQSAKKQDVEDVSPVKKSQTKSTTETSKKDEEKLSQPAKTRKSKRNADDNLLDEIEADSAQSKKIKVEVKFSQDIKPVTPLKSILKSPSRIFVEEKQDIVVKEKHIKPKEGKKSKEKIPEKKKTESDDDDDQPRRRNAYQIMFSGLEKRDMAFEEDKRKLTILGAKMVDDMEKNFTLLVMDKFKRTIKFLLAISKGVDVVSYDWVTNSIKESKLLPTAKYIYSDKKAETQYKFKLSKTLEKARNQTEGLLEGHRVYLSNTIKPSLDEIKTLVESMGGTYIKTKPSELRYDTLIILEEDDEKNTKYFADMGYFSYTTELLYSAILQQKLDLKHHKISSDN